MFQGAAARCAVIVAVTFSALTVADDGRAGAEPIAPRTVPTAKNWVRGDAEFVLGARARVLYSDAVLGDTAAEFADGLRTATGKDVVAQAGSAGAAGDIVLRLGPVPGAPETLESYRMVVGPTLELQGAGAAGAFYATRSALQLLRGAAPIPGGVVTDWPDYAERSLMLDVGRQYLPPDLVRAQIRRMGMLKLNVLHLHLSDTFGFRLESTRHPAITAAQHYSKQEIRDLIAYAARYQVEIVPEVDFPGHMNGILAAYPELKLRSAAGVVSDAAIDISDPRSYDLMRDILAEFLPLFPGRYWHLGADEFLLDGLKVSGYEDYPQLGAYARAAYGPQAEPVDALLGLINWGADIVRAHGKRPRIWNDGLHTGAGTLAIGGDIVIDYWSRAGVAQLPLPFFGTARTPQDLIAAGHQVKNAAFLPTYFVAGGPAAVVANQPPVFGYELWDPAVFVDGSRLTPAQNAANLGSGLHVWCDDPTARTPEQIAAAITVPLRVLAQKTWGPPHPTGYAEFTALAEAIAEPIS
ncbi:family 20 glycosylhydrolase [Nocardia sp. NPDC048505]|uniref:family 20 glycosylhydrolase n=1 Tax=unclassified Nocardia TaxID=2637762 RepID=UPI0033D49BA0